MNTLHQIAKVGHMLQGRQRATPRFAARQPVNRKIQTKIRTWVQLSAAELAQQSWLVAQNPDTPAEMAQRRSSPNAAHAPRVLLLRKVDG